MSSRDRGEEVGARSMGEVSIQNCIYLSRGVYFFFRFSVAVCVSESEAFSFTCLLHTYFSLPHISQTSVSGLGGLTYIDKVATPTLSLCPTQCLCMYSAYYYCGAISAFTLLVVVFECGIPELSFPV